MEQLQIVNVNGRLLVDSREVAEMTGVRHGHLLEKIDGYVEIIEKSTEPKIRLSDFFTESTYMDSTGRTLKRYLLTRKGCDMIANKMTGEKGVLFTAAYVTKFEEMERTIANGFDISALTPELQMFKHLFDGVARVQIENQETKRQLAEVTTTVNVIQETFLQRDEDWRKSINHMLNASAFRLGGNYRELRNKSYEALEERARCKLDQRLRNLVERLERSGSTKTQLKNTTRMDVIESDPRLKEIYTTIVKEISIGSLKVKSS